MRSTTVLGWDDWSSGAELGLGRGEGVATCPGGSKIGEGMFVGAGFDRLKY
jgi:hypothetical protein